jgi:ubiquinone/menaquinone biosynthesis C-methylase UbiE
MKELLPWLVVVGRTFRFVAQGEEHMSTRSGEFAPKLGYLIDVEHAGEMDRLERQSSLITENTGLFPTHVVPADGQTLLDLACGPGEWAMQVARDYPNCQVIGVDISERMIAYARSRARMQRLSNVQFEIADVHEPLAFPDNSLDLVHARFLVSFLSVADWPKFLAECFRVLRPAGVMCSTEFENWGTTTSTAITRMNTLILRLFHQRHQCFVETGEHLGIMAVQAHLLQASGFAPVYQKVHVLNYSAGTPAHGPMAGNLATFLQLLEASLVQRDIIGQEELSLLYAQLLKELYVDDFCGVTVFQTAWGKKPPASPA